MPDHSAAPVYTQVADALVRDIAAGRLADRARLPPERTLAEQFGVSVGTLRKSLAQLEEQGLLNRIQGSGNYVDASGIRDNVYAMFRLERPSGGGFPRAQVLDVAQMAKPQEVPAFGASQSGTRIRRLRFLSDVPVAIEEIWLDSGVGILTRADIGDALYQTYQSRLGLWIDRVEDKVSVGAVPDWAPSEFAPAIDAVVGYVERLSWANHPQPVEFSRTWFDPDRAVYVQRLA